MSQSSQRYYEMYLPKYLKCLAEVRNPPFTLMIVVYLRLVYSSSSRVCLFLPLSFFWGSRVELAGSVSGKVRVLKKPGGGKKMHSVFERIFSVPM